MNLTPEQGLRYFTARLQEPRRNGNSWMFRCLWHADRNPSLAVPTENPQVYFCHGCRVKGNALQFEVEFAKLSGREITLAEAEANICRELGIEPEARAERIGGGHIEATYRYTDAGGKLRYAVEIKRFDNGEKAARFKRPDGAGGWVYDMAGVERLLYRLPEVVRANQVFVCEGEKCCEALISTGLQAMPGAHIAVTTTGAATSWDDRFGAAFYGAQVIVLADNDEPGELYAEAVCHGTAAFCSGSKIVRFPDTKLHGDVADWLPEHSLEALLNRVREAPTWEPPKQTEAPRVLIAAQQFMAQAPPEIEWLVEGVIQRRASGIIGALPGLGKSWCAIDLALALALGQDWLGFRVPRAVNVALVSREDPPQLTGWRMRQLLAGRNANPEELGGSFYVNSQRETESFLLDNAEHVAQLTAALRGVAPEFLVLDVFNVLHGSDENDQAQMRRVLSYATAMQNELGCAIALLHHFRKPAAGVAAGALVEQLRGSSAIGGWRQWIIGLRWEDEAQHLRRMQFEMKAAPPPNDCVFRIETRAEKSWLERESDYRAPRPADASALLNRRARAATGDNE